jgi:hypothetical protein
MDVVIRGDFTNSYDHPIRSRRRALLGEAHQLSIPVEIEPYRKVNMEVGVPSKLPCFGTVKALAGTSDFFVGVSLHKVKKWCK